MIDIEKINALLNDIWNFQLLLFGLVVTLFTVIYSFIITKRDELRSIAYTIKSGDQTSILKQRETFAKNYIVRLKKINNHLIILILITFSVSLIGWLTERFISNCEVNLKKNILLILASLTSLVFIFISIQSYKIFIHYRESTKI